jgi:ABC-type transport system substrate-binding protein
VKFHDGTTFDAAAVKTNLERIQQGQQGFAYKGLIAAIQEIKVVDPTSVQLVLSTRTPALGSVLGFSPFFMQSPAALTKHGAEYGGQVGVGTGPYTVTSRTPGGDVALQRNSAYWGDKPYLDGVVFRTVKDAGARMASLESGELDLASGVPPTDLARLKADSRLDVRVVGTPRQAMLYMNNLKAPLSNKLVRQAIMYGTNRPAYVETLLKGIGEMSDSMVGTGVFGYAAQKPYPFDPKKAKDLLAQAGVAEGTNLELATVAQFETHAAAIAQDLAQIGLKVNVVKFDLNALIEYLLRPADKSAYQMIFSTRTSQYGDAEFPIITDFHSANWTPKGANGTFYKNPQVDAFLDQTKSEADPAKRASQFAQALALLWEDLPEIPMYRVGFAVATSKSLRNLEITAYERLRLEKAWLDR